MKKNTNIQINDTLGLNIITAPGINNYSPSNYSSSISFAMHQSLINCTKLLFIVADIKGVIQLFSPGAELILNYKAAEVINILPVIDLCDPQFLIERTDDLNSEFKSNLKPGFETLVFHASRGIEDYCVLKCISKKGLEVQIEISINFLLNDLGKHTGYMFTGTESYYSPNEGSVQKAINKKIINYIENLSSGVFVTNSEGDYVQVNKAAYEVTGYSKTELLSMNLKEIVHPDDQEKAAESFRNLLQDGHSIFEISIINKSGNKRFWIINATKINSDSYLGIVNDITDLKIEERDFLDQKQEMDSFFSLSPNLLCIAERDFSFKKLNLIWQKTLGYNIEELDSLKYIDLVHPDDVILTGKALSSISPTQSIINFRNRFRCKTGAYIWIEWDVKLIGNMIYAVGRNIDSIIFYEKKLRQSKETAETKNRAKSNFLANMSHEIKNPLNAIIGFSELLQNTLKDEKQLSQIGAIRKSGKILLNLLNEILDLSKIEASQMKLELEPVDLNLLFSDTEFMFRQKILEKGISFRVDKIEDIPYTLMLDENHLRQVLFNLIGNALKFTEKGSICLAYQIVIKNKEEIDLTISVQDTGKGIPANQQKIIFLPFQQQKKQNSKKFGGTGLGLSISKRLTELMGGKLLVSSEPGKGSTFKIALRNIKFLPQVENKGTLLLNEIKFEASSELTDEQKSHLSQVITVLENDYLPLNEIVIKKQMIEQIDQFGKGLILLGESNLFQGIIDYGKKICKYADNFEIDNMMKTLKSFPEIIGKVKSMRPDASIN